MFPELFKFSIPDFLSSFIGAKQITIYSYATLIALGTLIAALYTKWSAKRELGITNLPNTFFYLIFIAGFVGGKLFFYLQDPMLYINKPDLILSSFNGGYVFYGSFIMIIPVIIWYLKKYKIPVLPMLDILAVTTVIVHAIGRLGCFAAGCCFGAPTDSHLGMVFPTTHNTAVHPTQLYEVLVLMSILLILLYVKNRQQFKGQIFLIYLMLYGFGRGILELFRGDERGYVIDGVLSHSQCIGLFFIGLACYFYFKFYKASNTNLIKV
ncbi:prolipoprotein diacylglyceryl transferase [Olleya sp. YSTF-M6]|uniref:Phosphatidylglycerol--prolipoprotein diacylglyceryl transferase n=1 Tax=Olleya sediminilitoris TaxID=2795739 RepID=A0ABS1WK43_9FLAO|nr:prolipoprotein diacylglyceryl transferase [Olleya sediminilitoris]MBL7559457.1 prolipoprotein diacylglyceryl transferase [Olleya sediminilitoris]